MRVLFDINVVLDVLLSRAPFAKDAEALMGRVARREITGVLAATAVTTLFYLVAKTTGPRPARSVVRDLLGIFEIAPVDRTVLERAASSTFSDFEDSVLYQAGHAVGVDAIVTRNQTDFRASEVPVLSPEELNAVLQLGPSGTPPV